jgi:hypothetical protein
MRLLLYKDLETRRVKAAFAKLRFAIEAGDFRSADIKKLAPTPYWRAKLDYANRLLLQFARYGDETVCLALEVIENHAYDKSRFLRGARIVESKIEREPALADVTNDNGFADAIPLRWLHASRDEFELLDKPIVFDDAQEAVRRTPAPLVLVGSAGSGKTAVTLAKLREAEGRILYVTQSAYLAQSARALYGALGYENPGQEAEFLSYRDFIETMRVPGGREVTFAAFGDWIQRHRASRQGALGDLDAHSLFEEFRGVLAAGAEGPLQLVDYLALGPRQSLLSGDAREQAYVLFERYRRWLAESDQFDLNLVAYEWRALAQPAYDFVVIDEVQDLTNVQLALVLATLKKPGQFLLCGDANQIVHPNFFSWASVRALFWKGLGGGVAQRQDLSVLQANFRNTRSVTKLANTLLKVKQARFGSIDRESNFLVQCATAVDGAVRLVELREPITRELDAHTRASVNHAVIVLRDEDKAAARERFRTPLLFSVHEAKGLEYPHVILYAFVSSQRAAYAEVCDGVTSADLDVQELDYRRTRDKSDKSLEIFKFYVNALYVAMTRAVETLTLVESDVSHPILGLLGLHVTEATDAMSAAKIPVSSREDWAREARKLELQGKDEQARAIRDTLLQTKTVPWTPWSETSMRELLPKALDRAQPSAKPRQALLDYALWHGQQAWVEKLSAQVGFQAAMSLAADGEFGAFPVDDFCGDQGDRERLRQIAWRAVASLRQKHLQPYAKKNFKDILHLCESYGVDHRSPPGATPLMMAARAGNVGLVEALLERGADPLIEDEFGHTPWLSALNRAMEDAEFARESIAGLFGLIAPSVLDVQTEGRLVRLERYQGEYWILSLMLAGFKTLRTDCVPRPERAYKYHRGFFAEALHATLECLPDHLWKPARRKRSYVNQVLARAEVDSPYLPARKLWMRTMNGYYLPNPHMLIRTLTGDAIAKWRPIYDALNVEWVAAGTAAPYDFGSSLTELVEAMSNPATAAEDLF